MPNCITNSPFELRVLFLLGSGDFQREVEGFHEAVKAHHVLAYLAERPNTTLMVRHHVESKPLPKNPYGSAPTSSHKFLNSSPLALFSEIAKSVVVAREMKSLDSARQIWSQARLRFWSKLFERSRVDIVMGIGLTREEVRAAAINNISTIEIQHGAFGESAVNFYWPEDAPDFFGIWLTTNPDLLLGSRIEPLVIPFPDLDEVKKFGAEEKILIPLSWGEEWIDSSDQFDGAMPRTLFNVLSINSHLASQFVFRSHPVFPRKMLPRLRRQILRKFPGAIFEIASSQRIEKFLGGGKVVLVSDSTVWMEALRSGIPVLTVSEATASRMRDFVLATGCGRFLKLEPNADLGSVLDELRDPIGWSTREVPKASLADWSDLERILESSTRSN